MGRMAEGGGAGTEAEEQQPQKQEEDPGAASREAKGHLWPNASGRSGETRKCLVRSRLSQSGDGGEMEETAGTRPRS